MNAPTRRPNQKPKKKLPYLTEEDLNTQISAVKIKITGKFFVRGDHRGDVYVKDYEAEIVVPKTFNMGHVKLQSNRYVKKNLNGVRVRTFNVDTDFTPEPITDKKYFVKDFISDMGIQDNIRNRENYLQAIERKRRMAELQEDPDYTPPIGTVEVSSRVTNDHDYAIGSDE